MNEIQHQANPGVGAAKFVLYNPAGEVWNGTAFDAWSDGAIATYGIAMTADGTGGHFRGDFPAAITTPGRYSWVVYEQAIAAALAITDVPATTPGFTDWNGTFETTLADALTEPTSVPGANATLAQKVSWIFALHRNKRTQTRAGVDTVRNDGDTAAIGTSSKTDDGQTFTRSEFV